MAQAFSSPTTLNLAYSPPASQQGNALIANASVVFRSRFVPDGQLLYKFGNVLRLRGSRIRRSRLSAVAELQEAATAAEQQFFEPSSSSVINTSPLSAEIQTLDSSHSDPAVFDDAPSILEGSGGTGPGLIIPESNSSTIFPSVDATVTETPQVDPAADFTPAIVRPAETGSDVLQGAGESLGNPVELTPLQRYEALINRASGDGARKPMVPEEDVASFSFPDSVEAVQESAAKTIIDIQDAIHDAVGSASHAMRDVYDHLNGSINGSVDSVAGSFKGLMNSVTGLYVKTLDDTQTSVGSFVSKAGGEVADFTSTFSTGTSLNNQLREVAAVVKGATGTVSEATGKILTDIYGTARVNLPSEMQFYLSVAEQKVQDVSEPFGNFLKETYRVLEEVERALGVDPEDPIIPVILVVGGALYLGYGGYSGDLIPTSAFDLLKKEGNVILVDIRPQDLRESEGIPDFRRGMRSRFATVETITVDASLRSRLKNAKEIDSVLTSSVIRNLKTVSPYTKVIVMDNDGSQSKEIARALQRFGVRDLLVGEIVTETIQSGGGYKAWVAAGLRTKLQVTDTPVSILQEDAAEVVEEVKPAPDAVVLVALGLVAGVYAAFEWEKALQLLGVIGIGQAIYTRANSYESLEDAKADLRLVQKPFRSLSDAILWAVGRVKLGTLQLATSPSTSAVQDRVLQAAVKHGPLLSELVEDGEAKAEDDAQYSPESTTSTSTAEVNRGDFSPPTASE